MDKQDKQRLEKIASLQMHGVGQKEIAQACCLTEGRISQIMASEDYQLVLGEMSSEFLERQRTMNEGWDALEEQSLTNLYDMLKYNKNPDFLLRVAAVANRANRRGTNPVNKPLDASLAGRVVIQLNQTFVHRLQQAVPAVAPAEAKPIISGEAKQVDIMQPKRVEELLEVPQQLAARRKAAAAAVEDEDLVPGFGDVEIS